MNVARIVISTALVGVLCVIQLLVFGYLHCGCSNIANAYIKIVYNLTKGLFTTLLYDNLDKFYA